MQSNIIEKQVKHSPISFFYLLKFELSQGINFVPITKKGKNISKLVIIGIVLFVWLITISEYLGNLDSQYMFAISVEIITFISLFFSYIKNYDNFFSKNDFSILSPMPIKWYKIIWAKLVSSLLISIMLIYVCIIPSFILYFFSKTTNNSVYINVLWFFAPILITPFFTFVGTIAIFLVNFIASNFKYRGFVSLLLHILVFGIYIVLGSIIPSYKELGLNKWWHDLFATITYGTSNIYTDWRLYISYSIIGISLLSIMFLLISKFYYSLYATITRSHLIRRDYKYKQSITSKRILVFKIHQKQILNHASYIINLIIFPIIVAIIMSISYLMTAYGNNDPQIIFMLRQIFMGFEDYYLIPIFLVIAISCLFTITNSNLACLSIDGDSHWLFQASPISKKDYLIGKYYSFIIYTIIPEIIFLIVLLIPSVATYSLNPWMAIIMFFSTIILTLYFGFFGMWLNWRFHNYSWKKAYAVTKNSVAIFINFFTLLAFAAYVAFISFYLCPTFFPNAKNFIALCFFIGVPLIIVITSFFMLRNIKQTSI